MKINTSITQLIGKTPLLELKCYSEKHNLKAKIVAKLEYLNPAGSVKDRVALAMVEDAEAKGLLKPGATIFEPTSGNTGIGLALVAAAKGYKLVLTMPETMSIERRKLVKAYGAEVVLTDGAKGMTGAIEKAEELHKQTPGSIIAGQFVNPANPMCHKATTGPEIWEDTDGTVDIFVAGVGTGGTLSGVGKYLKEKNSSINVVGVEPFSSPLITKGYAGAHGLQGIGANFIPDNFDSSVIDEVLTVKDEDAFRFSKMLATEEGLLVGITAGANLFACVQLAKEQKNKGKTIVTVMPDSGSRYLSTKLFK